MTDTLWFRIQSFLNTFSGIYMGNEARCQKKHINAFS